MPSTALTAYVHLSFLAVVNTINKDDCDFYNVNMKTNIHRGKRLTNHNLLNATVDHPVLCFNKCAGNCFCKSFNVCGKRCELSTSTKESSPTDYKNETECAYYDMAGVPKSELSQSKSSCDGSAQKFCCQDHNPCLNSGVCIGFCTLQDEKRFECKCKPGYYGDRCQARLPSTCQDYWTIPKPSNGMYRVFDENNVMIKVFCDFHSEDGTAWTLFLSRDLNHATYPLWKDFSGWNVDQQEITWAKYRLPKDTLVHLSTKSTHWRITCEFNNLGVDFVDYLRSKLSETNPLLYNHGNIAEINQCRMVEYVNIRGRHCTSCTVVLGQGSSCVLYSMEPRNSDYGCDFDGSNFVSDCSGIKNREFYFGCGGYGCRTGRHRCNENSQSTLQYWFGG